jgi:hypothetical protein
MAVTPKLFITAFRNFAVDDFGRSIIAPDTPPLGEFSVEITHQSLISDPFPQWTGFVQIKAEADCCLAFAAKDKDAEADPDFHFVEAGERLFYGAKEGYRIAVIAAA